MIFTHVCFLNETQRDRARWVPRCRSGWAQTFLIFGHTCGEGGLAADRQVWDGCRTGMGAGPGWVQVRDGCRTRMGAGLGLNLWPVSQASPARLSSGRETCGHGAAFAPSDVGCR